MERPNRPPDKVGYAVEYQPSTPHLVAMRAVPISLFHADYVPEYSPSMIPIYYKLERWDTLESTIGLKTEISEEEYWRSH